MYEHSNHDQQRFARDRILSHDIKAHVLMSCDSSHASILGPVLSENPQEYSPTGLNKLAGTSANIESWKSSGILQESVGDNKDLPLTLKSPPIKADHHPCFLLLYCKFSLRNALLSIFGNVNSTSQYHQQPFLSCSMIFSLLYCYS